MSCLPDRAVCVLAMDMLVVRFSESKFSQELLSVLVRNVLETLFENSAWKVLNHQHV